MDFSQGKQVRNRGKVQKPVQLLKCGESSRIKSGRLSKPEAACLGHHMARSLPYDTVNLFRKVRSWVKGTVRALPAPDGVSCIRTQHAAPEGNCILVDLRLEPLQAGILMQKLCKIPTPAVSNDKQADGLKH